MAIICPNFNIPEVAQEFNELKNAIGEKAAYAVWSLNNGNSIEQDPNGGPSRLFSELLTHYGGNREQAIRAKAYAYGNTFRGINDWLNGPFASEPTLRDVLDNYTTGIPNDFNDIVADDNINQMLNIPHVRTGMQQEFLKTVDTTGMTQDEIDEAERQFYARQYQYSLRSAVSKLASNLGLRIYFDGTVDKNITPTRPLKYLRSAVSGAAALALPTSILSTVSFGLIGAPVIVGAAVLGATARIAFDKNLFSFDMRKLFLQTMVDRLSDPHYSKYALYLLSSLYNNDHISSEVSIRQVAEIYVDSFWNDDLVQTAVKQMHDMHPNIKQSQIKQMVVDNIIGEVEGHSLIQSIGRTILNGISKLKKKAIRTVIFNLTCKHIAKAMCCHDYLTDVKKDAMFKALRKYGSFAKGEATEADGKTVIEAFIALNKARLHAVKLYSNEELRDDEIKALENNIAQLEAVNIENVNEVNLNIISFIHAAYNEIAEAIDWLDNHRDVNAEDFDKAKMNDIRDSVIKGYRHILLDFILPYSVKDQCDAFVKTEIEELDKTLSYAISKFLALETEWGDAWIQDYMEYVMRGQFDNIQVETAQGMTNATTIAKENARLSLHNKIRKTGLSHWFGKKVSLFASVDQALRSANYASEVIRNAVDHLVRQDDHNRNVAVQKKKNKLIALYKKAQKLGTKFSPVDYFNMLCEHDGKAKTANFISPVNVGKYENDLHRFQQELFDDGVQNLIKSLKFLKSHVEEIKNGTPSAKVQAVINRVLTMCGRTSIDLVSYLNDTTVEASFDPYEYIFTTDDILINSFWQNQIDRFNDGKKHRRYKADYYIARRSILSPDTEVEYQELSDRISAIRQKAYDKELKYYDYSKLSPSDRAKLKQLEFQLEQMSNPYDIVINARGEIVSATEKTGAAARMAEELRRWNEVRREHISYSNNDEKFEAVRKHIEDTYGTSSPQYIQFMEDNTYWKEDEYIHRMLPDTMDEELKRLLLKKNYILKYAKKNPKAYEHPNLNLLSVDVLKQLKAIDEEIARYVDSHPQESASVDSDILEEYHRLTWNEEAIDPLTNMSYMNEIRMKYGSAVADVLRYTVPPLIINEPLSIFSRRVYDDSIIHQEYSNQFQDYNGDWVDPEWEEESDYMNVDKNVYANEDYLKVEDNPELKAFYDELIATMDEIWDMYPKHRRHYRFLMPLMTQEGLRKTMTQNRPKGLKTRSAIGLHFSEFFGDILNPDENSDEFVEQFLIKPDGSVMELIPLRFIKPLKGDSWAVDNDIIKTVIMMYDAALAFKGRKEVEQTALLIQDVQAGSFSGMMDEDQITTAKRLKSYMSSKLYGNTKQKVANINGTDKMSSWERFAWKLSRTIQSLTAKSFLNWNLTSWGKNALDSTFAVINTCLSGFKLRHRDVWKGVGQLICDLPQAITNPANASTRSWTGAAMQFHRVHEGAEYSAQKASQYWVRRFMNQFFQLGPFTLIDYTAKGILINATYNHYKLITDPITGEQVFLTKQQARRRFGSGNGMKKSDADDLYKKSNVSLHDAYYVDAEGNFTVKPQYKNIVNPILTKNFDDKYQTKKEELQELARRRFGNSSYVYDENGISEEDEFVRQELRKYTDKHRDTLLSTEVTGRINELASVVNGMFSQYKDNQAVSNVLGSMFFLMRGWFVTQYNDHYKDDNTFMEHQMKNGKYEAVEPTNLQEEDLRGKFNMATGELERGDMIDNFESGIAKIFFGSKAGIKQLKSLGDYFMRLLLASLCLWNSSSSKSFKNNFTEHEKYQLKYIIGISAIMLFNICSSKYTCNLVREADKQYVEHRTPATSAKAVAANYLYTILAGVQAEQISKFSRFGVILSLVDFAMAPLTTEGYVKDIGVMRHGIMAAATSMYDECFGTHTYDLLGYGEEIKRYSAFLGMTTGEAAMIGSTAVIPGLQDFNLNNLYKSTTVNGLRMKQSYAMKQSGIPLLGKLVTIPYTDVQFSLFGKYQPFLIYKPYGQQTGLVPHLIEGEKTEAKSPYNKKNQKSIKKPKYNSGSSRGGGRGSSKRGGGRGGNSRGGGRR